MPLDLSRVDRLTLLLVLSITVAILIAFWSLLDIIFLSVAVAVVAMPLQRRLARRFSPHLSALLTTSLVFLAFMALLAFTVGILYQNLDLILGLTLSGIEWIQGLSDLTMPYSPLLPSGALEEWLSGEILQFEQQIGALVRSAPTVLLDLSIFFLSIYFFVLKGEAIVDEVMRLLPENLNRALQKLISKSVETIYAILVVELTIAVVTFFLAIPFFYALDYGNVLFFSAICGIFQLIPFLGQSVIMLVLGAFALSSGDLRALLLVLLVGIPVVTAFPDIYMRPVLMGRRTGIHPVIMWIGIFGGVELLGLIGFILGPLLLALGVTAYHILIDELKAAQNGVKRDEPDDRTGHNKGNNV